MSEFDPTVQQQGPVIASFDDLIATALSEPVPCRLLTVLVAAETAYRRRQGVADPMVDEGCLTPVMAHDWRVSEELGLATIVATADDVTPDWRFIMTAVMPGQYGQAPSSQACEPHLERMAKALMVGERLDEFVFFDRQGMPVQISQAVR